jgi:hypothetical protein
MDRPDRDKDDWITALQQAQSGTVDKIPVGFKTRRELASELGFSIEALRYRLPILVDQGKVEVGYYKCVAVGGMVRKCAHYRIKKSK